MRFACRLPQSDGAQVACRCVCRQNAVTRDEDGEHLKESSIDGFHRQ